MQKWMKWLWLSVIMTVSMIALVSHSVYAAGEKTDASLDKIEKSGKLVLGLSADYAPYEFHTTIKGKDQIVGFDVKMDKLIAKRLGVKLVLKEMNNDALLMALKSGKVDIVISGITPTAERRKEVDFSDVYFNDPNVILVKKADHNKFKTLADFKAAKIGAQITTTQEDQAKKYLLGAKIISLKKVTDEVAQLSEGTLDGIVVPTTTATSYIMQDSNVFAVAPVKVPGGGGEAAIVMRKNSPVLKAKINHILETEVLGAPMKKWRAEAMQLMVKKESFFHKYYPYFLKGTVYTVELAVIGITGGFILGLCFAFMKIGKFLPLKIVANIYIEFFRGTPLLVQVMMVYFGTQILGITIDGFVSGAIAMILNSGAYVAEIIRSGVNSIPDGQREAARSLGFSRQQAMRLIVLPQAIRNILPALGNEFISVLKDGSIISVIGVGELTFQTSVVQGASFRPFLPLVITAIIYFVLSFGLSRILHSLEHKMNHRTT